MQPLLHLEVGDSQRRQEAALGGQDVAERVAEGALTVAAALAGEERRLGLAEPAPFEASLLLRARDPQLRREGERDGTGVEIERGSAVMVEVLLLVELQDAWRFALLL